MGQRGDSPEQRIEHAVREYARTGRTAEVEDPQRTADTERLLDEVAVEPRCSPARRRALHLAGWLCLARHGGFAGQRELPDLPTTVTRLGLLHDVNPDLVGGHLWELAVEFGADPDSRAQAALMMLVGALQASTDPLLSLTALERALDEVPPGHPRRAEYHLFAAHGWLERHGLTGDTTDLTKAVALGRGALLLTEPEDPERVEVLKVVCASLTRLSDQQEIAETVRVAVEMCRKLLSVAPVGGKDHTGAELSLGSVLLSRFEHTQAVADLDEAVGILRRGTERERRAGGARPESLVNLGLALHKRYRLTRVVEDLEEAITVFDAAARLAVRRDKAHASSLRADVRVLEGQRASVPRWAAVPRPAPPTAQSRLEEGTRLIERWKADDDLLCRDRAIELLGPVLGELPEDHPDLAVCSGYLGYALLRRYRYGGLDPADLAAAQEAIHRAVRTCRPDSPNLAGCLTLQAEAAYCQYQRFFAAEDLDAAIAALRRLLSLAPPSERDYWQALHNLGSHLAVRYDSTAALCDADEAIELLRHSLSVAGPSVEDPGHTALRLGEALLQRARDTEAPHDLDEARDSLSTALRLLPSGDPRRERAQQQLDIAVQRQEEERRAYEETVLPVLRRMTFDSGPDDQPTVPPEAAARDSQAVVQYQRDLTEARRRFDRTGDASALEAGIATGRRLLAGLPAHHPERAPAAAVFGALLLRRFEQHGDRKDIDDAIEHLKYGAYGPLPQVQHLRNMLKQPDADMQELRRHFGTQLDALLKLSRPRGSELSTLAGAHLRRFEYDGGGDDLDKAVHSARRAVEVTPPEYAAERHGHIQTLGMTLLRRYERTGNRADLDRAIDLGRQALVLARRTASATDDQLTSLGALCNRLRTRFLLTRDASDLDEAVALGTEATVLTQDGRIEPISRLNLALALWSRSLLRDNPADLDAAIGHAEAVVDAPNPSTRQRTHTLLTLANMLASVSERGDTGSRPNDADRSLALYREAAQAPTSPAADRLTAAVAWGRFAADRAAAGGSWQDAADGYAVAVELLPLTAWRGLARTDRERLLAERSHVAGEAAACAIACGRLEQAVELLDHGRSVLWGQVLDTRTDLTALRETHPALTDRLAGLRAALEEGTWTAPGQDTGEQLRQLAHEWEELLGEVRRLPGFEHFLVPLPFSMLSGATAAGPLVIVNVSRYRCDTLVVTPGRVTLVPLPGLTTDEAERRTERYLSTLDRLNQPGASAGPSQQTVMATLEWLWDTVAAPVLDSPEMAAWRGRRVWWCPTGPLALLPVHAAGYHDPDDGREHDAVMARVVSSYMPTLRGLIRAKRPSAVADADRRLLVLALGDQPPYAPLLRPLPGARKEAEALSRRFPGRQTVILDSDATCQKVLSLLASHSCVHFACHAGQDLADPGTGALYLYDRPLKVSDLARLDLPSAELAVLSACQTALGGTELPNEAIHLAGALLLGNFRQVVSTLWTVGDDTARQITDEVYEIVAHPELGIDPSRTAYALHEAVDRARRRQPYRPVGWASYVHFGL
ncbi:CHAT domain-containing protein [Streptomyces sp. NPDC056910]|uniref:CHAT domain-containing protein n=1 Tax=Streptomyces sp. NPDC056910 TaxID=3345964 RepID=UPI00368F7F14